MVSLDKFQELADEAAADIPQEFFNKLNGGIVLLERAKLHPDSVPGHPLYIMGEFTHSAMMGRHILLYYGSFTATYGYLGDDELKERIRHIILHEFTHHLESLAMTRELEKDDIRRLAQYKAQFEQE